MYIKEINVHVYGKNDLLVIVIDTSIHFIGKSINRIELNGKYS